MSITVESRYAELHNPDLPQREARGIIEQELAPQGVSQEVLDRMWFLAAPRPLLAISARFSYHNRN